MYYISQLLTNRYLRHGISNVDDGNMSYRYGGQDEVKKSRRNFLVNLRIPSERSIFIEVQHGTKIIKGTSSLAGAGFNSKETAIKADAIVATEKNLALVIMTADCIPVIIFDKEQGVLSLAHVSRHNSRLAFLQILITLLRREFNVKPQDLQVYFGPSIKRDSYVLPQYPKGYDLVGESVNQMMLKGVRRENIVIDPNDTVINPEFFSYYRDVRSRVKEGRFATAAMLV